jgi:uncharacterized protein YndB with AHSA1/START domain
MNTTTENPVLEIQRLIDAPSERVFDAWMNREEWETWMGPEGCRCELTLFEPRVDGRYRIVMRMSDGRELIVGGTFQVIEAPYLIALTWKWEHGEHDSLVTIRMNDIGGETELTLRHEGLLTQENCEGHNQGWSGALDKLEAYLADA